MVTESISSWDGVGPRNMVLVADDSEAIRTRLAALVRHVPGVSAVVQAASAQEVWACLFRVPPRVALIDVHLDDRGGGVLLSQIQKQFPATVLVALTRYAGSQLAATYRDCGADHCFDKATELEAIIRTVAEAVRPMLNNEDQRETP